MVFIIISLFFLFFSCTPIVDSMLLKEKDGTVDQIQPDADDAHVDSDTSIDNQSDAEDVLVETPPIVVHRECASIGTIQTESYDPANCHNTLNNGEKCDDGNDRNGDGCDPLCLFETHLCTWASRFAEVADVAAEGNFVYVADAGDCTIKQIDGNTGNVLIFAGMPFDCADRNGTGTGARFNRPRGLEVMGSFLLVVDSGNHKIRKINLATQMVTDLAGDGSMGTDDGPCISAQFRQPVGIATDGARVFIADPGSGDVRIIHNPLESSICMVETMPIHDGPILIRRPHGLACHPKRSGFLFMSDSDQNIIVRVDIGDGLFNTVIIAGNPGSAGSLDATGSGATFRNPTGIDINGHVLIVADTGNHLLREIELFPHRDECRVTTFAGAALNSGCVDTTLRGDAGRLNHPVCVTFKKSGGVENTLDDYLFYFCDEGCKAIRIGK